MENKTSAKQMGIRQVVSKQVSSGPFTSKGGGHTGHSRPLEEFVGVHKALVGGMDHHSEGEEEDEHHRGHHRHDGEEDSHQSEHGVGCAEDSHHGHNSPDGEKLESARDSGNADYNHGEEASYRNHQWQHKTGEESETGMARENGHQGTGSVVEMRTNYQAQKYTGVSHRQRRSLWSL